MAAFNPALLIGIKVEIYAGPTLGWVDVTARGRAASCVIKQGMSANAIQPESSMLDLTLGNPDGYLTEDNAVSPWYGYWGRGCPIRVSRIGLTVSPAERFHGKVQSIEENYPGGNVDATVRITAVGTLGILGLGSDPLRSAAYRAMTGVSEGDFQPVSHWSCEDGSGATQIAASIPGQPAGNIRDNVTLASFAGAVGSQPLPVLNSGDLNFAVPTFTATGTWQVQFLLAIPSLLASDVALVYIYPGPGDVVAEIRIVWNSTFKGLDITAYNSAGTVLGTNGGFDDLTPDTPVMVGITSFTSAGTRFIDRSLYRLETGTNFSSAVITPGGTTTTVRQVRAHANSVSSGWSFGQLGIYSDAAVITTPSAGPNARAAGGYVGETAADRMARLCQEEAVGFELTGTASDTVAMGPQLTDTLFNNLRDCAITDQGLLHDNGTDGAVGYVTRRNLYNQTATIAVIQGSVEPSLRALRDYQYVRNDVTSTRSGGASAHVADETHVARIGARLKDTRTPNVEADDQLPGDASWAVHLGTASGARYNSVGINLRNTYGALLADAVVAHAIGDRLTVASTALPPQHHIAGIDGLTIGWTETLDADTWIFRANLVPYSPYDVARYDTDGDRYDSAYTFLRAAATTTAASLTVGMDMDKLRWITGSGGAVFTGLYVGCEGEKIGVSSIASIYKDTFTRTVSNSWDTADTGHTYSLSGGTVPGDYDITGSVATMTLTSNNVAREATVNSLSVADGTLYGRYLHPVVPTGASHEAGVRIRRVDASNFCDMRMFFGTGNTITYVVRQVVAGVESAVSSFVTVVRTGGSSVTTTTQLAWRVDFFGTTLRARVWAAADTEPTYWGVTTTVSHLAAGSASFVALTGAASTNVLPIVPQWDSLEMANPQTWGVTRSANGVVKTHSAGAQVRLWTPAVYAY